MSFSKRLFRGALIAALALQGAVAFAGPYSNMYVFGDSLSDIGNDLNITAGSVPSPAYFTDGSTTGRFTNGVNYVDLLAQHLGLSVTASTAGGTDYAYGGARGSYMRPELVPYGALSFNQQIAQYTSGLPAADPNALYVLWIGANDMSDAISAALAGNGLAIGQQINQTIGDILAAMGSLETLGATHFLIGDVPNLGLTPAIIAADNYYGAGGAIEGLATGVSSAFNAALYSYLPSVTMPGVDVNIIDAFGIQSAIAQNPAAYGITNTTDACYNGNADGSVAAGQTSVTVCANPAQYQYFDTEHPSATMNAIVANAIISTLPVPEPTDLALSLGALGLMGFARRRRQHA